MPEPRVTRIAPDVYPRVIVYEAKCYACNTSPHVYSGKYGVAHIPVELPVKALLDRKDAVHGNCNQALTFVTGPLIKKASS